MMSYRKVLRFLCINTVIFLYHGICCAGILQVFENSQNTPNETVQNHLRSIRVANPSAIAKSKVGLCDAGEYVAQCGDYRVGFNWLKRAKLPDPENPSETIINYKETLDYYVDEDVLSLFTRMRIFFGNENELMLDNNGIPFDPNTIKKDREAILNNLCHPSDSKAKIICKPCPNDAKVESSTVALDENYLTIQGSWNFHTIADCYMKQFEDTTGIYFYVPDDLPAGVTFDNATFPDNAESCYYTNTNPNAWDALAGDEIGTFMPGINTNLPEEEKTIKILTSGAINK